MNNPTRKKKPATIHKYRLGFRNDALTITKQKPIAIEGIRISKASFAIGKCLFEDSSIIIALILDGFYRNRAVSESANSENQRLEEKSSYRRNAKKKNILKERAWLRCHKQLRLCDFTRDN